jgi:mono/diheme cytochrome c family protein
VVAEPTPPTGELSGTQRGQPEPDHDVDALHAAIAREKTEPREGREPISVGLVLVYMALLGWGGWYLGKYGADFDPRVLPSEALGAPASAGVAAAPKAPRGEVLYNTCSACHQRDARGLPGQYPPLAGSERLTGDPGVPIRIVLDGISGPLRAQGAQFNGPMPPFRDQLSDEQIAAVLSFERSHFGNTAPGVSIELVTQIRAETAARGRAWTAAELDALPGSQRQPPGAEP